MRKVIVATFVSLDGVMQAPGGPDEDRSGGFRFGGWVAPHSDEETGAAVGELFAQPFDLLLGRTTYDIFAAYWPYFEKSEAGAEEGHLHIARTFNTCTKFVATHRPETLAWHNSRALGSDVASAIRNLKASDGPDLVVQGSAQLIHQLLRERLVDHMQLMIFPIILGKGKRMFDEGSAPQGLAMTRTSVSPSGVIIARYDRGGEVATGSFVGPDPSPEEIERRARISG